MARPKSFYRLLTEAIAHFAERGYTSQAELEEWVRVLKKSIGSALGPQSATEAAVRRNLKAVYSRLAVKGVALRNNRGVSKFDLDKLKPAMRRELQKRILASVNLIKLNREEAIATTLRRFQGWATAVPKGGSKALDVRKEKAMIKKPLSKITYQERRVTIDQSQKFAASLNAVIAQGNDAIAAEWQSRWRTPGYDYREDHKERSGHIFAIRDNWAIQEGLMKVGAAGYTDAITQPAEEVFCQCRYVYIYSIDYLPADMLTDKGRKMIAKAKAK
jgi:hypothetical protein